MYRALTGLRLLPELPPADPGDFMLRFPRETLTFQFSHRSHFSAFGKVVLVRADGSGRSDVPLTLRDWVPYNSNFSYSTFTADLSSPPPGQYYMDCETDHGARYSDVFELTDDAIALTFANATDLIWNKGILRGGEAKVSIDAELSPPVYRTIESLVSKDEVEHVKKQIATKSYSFSFIAPDFLTDFFALSRLFDTVEIRTPRDTFKVEGTACKAAIEFYTAEMAKVEFSFRTDQVIKKTQHIIDVFKT